ncbi:MAG: translational GTPase TypA [Patescibacteria group bacterium]
MEIRNIAIIAHVDHGKTTLTDALLKQTGMVAADFSMDVNALERERGITIYSKNASLYYKDTKINIVDTPGHADFGSEVERVLRSIDAVLLIVDAQEGPMPQTRFVLKKSLELGLKPILVINKIDKPAADPHKTHDEVLELFMELGANNEQLDFKTIYAIGRQGVAMLDLKDEQKDLTPLLELILREVRVASGGEDKPLLLQPFNLAYDNFLGRMGICRIYQGTIKQSQKVFVHQKEQKITKLFSFKGFERQDVTEASAGDIVMIAGIPEINIGETICESADQEPLPMINVDEPTISLFFMVNDSPLAGREGKFVTNRQIRERLEKELEVNVGLKIDFTTNEYYTVYGRGELHIAILLENMRREGYEVQVSQPHVIIKEENGVKLEPFEETVIDVPQDVGGTIIETLGKRKGIMKDLQPEQGNRVRLIFEIPTRGILGYRNQFLIDTKGEGIFSSRVMEFRPYAGEIEKRSAGSMISMETGKTLAFSLDNLQQRGSLYVGPNVEVYEGMVIGNVSKGMDMSVNPIKGKQLTNMRSSGNDDNIYLAPPLEMTLESGLEIMAEDEYLEVTPKNIRLRKKYLTENDRVKAKR